MAGQHSALDGPPRLLVGLQNLQHLLLDAPIRLTGMALLLGQCSDQLYQGVWLLGRPAHLDPVGVQVWL